MTAERREELRKLAGGTGPGRHEPPPGQLLRAVLEVLLSIDERLDRVIHRGKD